MIEFLEPVLFKSSRVSWANPGSDSLLGPVLLGVPGDKLYVSSVILELSLW